MLTHLVEMASIDEKNLQIRQNQVLLDQVPQTPNSVTADQLLPCQVSSPEMSITAGIARGHDQADDHFW